MSTGFAYQHAAKLKRVFDNYTMVIVSENYDTETPFIESMLSDVFDVADRTSRPFPAAYHTIKALREAQQDFATTQVDISESWHSRKTCPASVVLKWHSYRPLTRN